MPKQARMKPARQAIPKTSLPTWTGNLTRFQRQMATIKKKMAATRLKMEAHRRILLSIPQMSSNELVLLNDLLHDGLAPHFWDWRSA